MKSKEGVETEPKQRKNNSARLASKGECLRICRFLEFWLENTISSIAEKTYHVVHALSEFNQPSSPLRTC